MDIRLINLDRSPDRLAAFQVVNEHVMPHVTRFSAVDGKDVERPEIVERGIIAPDLRYNDGALGNALSHIALWDFAASEGRSITICEDDAVFNRLFVVASESLLREIPQDWHLISWGWNFDSILWFDMIPGVSSCTGTFDQKSLRQGIDTFRSANLSPSAYRLLQAFGTICYSISPAGARSLRKNCLPLRNTKVYVPGLRANIINSGLDAALNGVYSHMNSFVSIPALVATPNDRSISLIQRKAVQQ